MELNDAGDYEQLLEDGSIVARFTDEGLLVDWFNLNGSSDRTLAIDWDSLYEQSLPAPDYH